MHGQSRTQAERIFRRISQIFQDESERANTVDLAINKIYENIVKDGGSLSNRQAAELIDGIIKSSSPLITVVNLQEKIMWAILEEFPEEKEIIKSMEQ